MAKKQEVEELFETIGTDAQAWLAQAKELKMAADAILPMLREALSIPPTQPGAQEKRFGFLHSYMLLTGLAFENIIKGILIGRNPSLVSKEKIESGILCRKGHGIADGAKSIISLAPQEVSLLMRMEEYLVWAGRYPLPLKSSILLNSVEQELRSFRSDDPTLVTKLFEKLAAALEQEWKARS